MDMKISSIQIKCRKQNIFIQLSNKISFIYGNTGVGKTTLLNLINYGLGNNLVKTLAIEQEVLGVCLHISLYGELICLERKINSNSIIMTRNQEQISLVAKNYKYSYRQSFSDFLYLFEGIEPIEMLRRNSSKEIKVNFSNFIWFSYLRQEELDNTLFYLGEQKSNYKELASTYVMKIILGEKEVSNKEINRAINKLRERKENVNLRVTIARQICASTKLFDLNLSQEIAKKKKQIVRLKAETAELKKKLLDEKTTNNMIPFDDLLEKERRIGIYEAEICYLGEFSKINKIKNLYLFELQQCETKIVSYEKIRANTDNLLFESNMEKLETIFFDCLLDVGFSFVEMSDFVKIDRKSFVPSIYSKDGKIKFDYYNLSSGGKKTIFKICYALAIHIFVVEYNIHSILPKFIIIDTPMKNMSEREDRDLYDNLYRFFVKLFAVGGKLETMQLIIVDKELPQVLQGKDIMCKHITKKEPLIPY